MSRAYNWFMITLPIIIFTYDISRERYIWASAWAFLWILLIGLHYLKNKKQITNKNDKRA